jgi:predicted naringenin-chalcone synthase
MYLFRFDARQPEFILPQAEALPWLAAIHAESGGGDGERLGKLLRRYGCSADRIHRRYSILGDFLEKDWSRMKILRRDGNPAGAGMGVRMQHYQEASLAAFESWYPDVGEAIFPDDLIHVSCTGYVSPSAPQVVLSRRKRISGTRVTHAYHMGCYAAFPAIRMAHGFLASGSRSADIAHTEFCTLHLDPSNHAPDQLVVQTLFGDGMIRYRAALGQPNEPALELLAVHEEMVADSSGEMTWVVSDTGLKMGLSREVPARISKVLPDFMSRLLQKAEERVGLSRPEVRCHAVHPGGPRIIDGVRDALGIDEKNVETSRRVLREQGNMSSATLPHIWKEMLADPSIADGAWIPSIAFGPGLTMTGAVMRKRLARR